MIFLRGTSRRCVSAALLGGELLETESRFELLGSLESDCANRLGPSPLKEGDRWNGHDVEGPLQARVLVDVNLHDVDLALVLRGKLLEFRGDEFAWTAPWRPEVHDDWARRIGDIRLERCIRGVLDLCHL